MNLLVTVGTKGHFLILFITALQPKLGCLQRVPAQQLGTSMFLPWFEKW
jgi:hypothetical protein